MAVVQAFSVGRGGDRAPGTGGGVPADGVVELDLAVVLGALSDPVRLAIVAKLADGSERACGEFELGIAKSTRSHHFNVLVQAGLLVRRAEGKSRMLRLRREALEQRFPGLLDAVLGEDSA